MPITTFRKEDIPVLLASQTIDASKGVLFGTAANMEPNKVNRTILIGLGGTGVKTIDYVKGSIMATLKPTWRNYVAFLGIDTDWNEFKKAKFLEPNECKMITATNVGTHGVSADTRSIAQRKLVPAEHSIPGINGPGAGRKRQVGTFKIHDQDAGTPGIDESIVSYISTIVADRLDPIGGGDDGNGAYEVYVVGSVCGGTCSGTFLELPALIDRALPGKPVHKRAILYLPDTLSALDPAHKSELFANGYASLKELDYYMGESMRAGYQDTWGYNNAADPEIKLPRQGDPHPAFFKLPYLVGSQVPGSREASQTAREAICEVLISLLGEMNSNNPNVFSLESHFDNAQHHVSERNFQNPVTKDAEASGENHDRPRHYAAIGYAEASAPEKRVRAYTLSKACKAAGLHSVSATERANLINHGTALLPFRAEDDLLSATEGTEKARKIVAPVLNILDLIHTGTFSFMADLNQPTEPTWDKIKNHEYDNQAIAMITSNVVQNRTNDNMMKDLRSKIHAMFGAYRTNVLEFVKDEGPLAFYNLFKGNFVPVGDNHGMGVETMLKNLVSGKTFQGQPFQWKDEAMAQSQLATARNAIDTTTKTLFKGNMRNTQCAAWVAAYENMQKARINNARRKFALGEAGSLKTDFLAPAQLLADELRYFGYMLESLSDIYDSFGSKVESFEAFRTAQDGNTDVNIASIDDSAYNWLKRKADETAATVNGRNFRESLVENFFNNRAAWIEIPENCVEVNHEVVSLVAEDVPVPARALFDQFASENMPPMINVSIQAMFDELNNNGHSYAATAKSVVSSLAAKSRPQFNGQLEPSFVAAVYPAALETAGGSGPQIAQALKEAFELRFDGKSLQVFSSVDADSIRCYQVAAPFEMYKLTELGAWEREYEAKLNAAMPTANTISKGVASMLHTMSPEAEGVMGQVYKETIPWEDYPSVTLKSTDPRTPDPVSGKISREGQARIKLDAIVEEAKKLGVLYVDNSGGNYLVKRVHCDNSIKWDHFDLMSCPTDERTGMILMGKALAQSVAEQHGIANLESISKPVILLEAGILSGAAASEELAWKNAARVLRAHVPMYRQILTTLEKFRVWAEDIIKYNREVMQRFRPAKAVHLMKSLLVEKNANGAWELRKANGTKQVLANLVPQMMAFLPSKDKRLLENGLMSYYLYQKIENALPGDALDERYAASKARYEDLLNQMAQEELVKGQEQSSIAATEAAVLAEKGMRMDGSEGITEKYRKEMASLGLKDDELLAIQNFYFRASLIDFID